MKIMINVKKIYIYIYQNVEKDSKKEGDAL